VRLIRRLTAAALAVSVSACSLWFALSDPYAGLGAEGGADAKPDLDGEPADGASPDGGPDDSGPDVVSVSLTTVTSGVGSIAVFGDTLYANTNGQLSVCTDAACSSLKVIVPVDASITDPPGLAVDDAGAFWVAADGIWSAWFDGTNAGLVIKDSNNPKVLAADGPRLSWTTQDDAGNTVINSCGVARSKCSFNKATGPDGGPGGASGAGNPIQIVGPGSDIDNTQLAAGHGFVLWVKSTDATMTYSPVDGGASEPINPATDDVFFSGIASTTTLVANDGPIVVYSFFSKAGNNPYVIERSQYPTNDQGAAVTPGKINTNKDNCFGAANGVVAYCPTGNQMVLLDEGDGGQVLAVPIGTVASPLDDVVATSHWIFLLDNNHVLYRYPRN